MKNKIKEILLKFETDIDNGSGIPNKCIDEIDYDDLTKELVKLFSTPDVSKRKFNINELRHIAVNFAITCEKGYKGDFDSWFSGTSDEWRKIANRK